MINICYSITNLSVVKLQTHQYVTLTLKCSANNILDFLYNLKITCPLTTGIAESRCPINRRVLWLKKFHVLTSIQRDSFSAENYDNGYLITYVMANERIPLRGS